MKTWYMRNLSANCFCIGPEVPLPADDYRYRLLLSSPGGALLPCRREDLNGEVSLRYDISGYLPFSDLVRPYSLRFPDLQSFAELLLTALSGLADSLLTAGDVLLCAPYLFVNVSLTRLKLVLYPWEKKEDGDPLAALFLSLFPLADPEDDSAALLLFRLYCAARSGSDLPRLLSVLYTAAGRTDGDEDGSPVPPVQPAGSRPERPMPPQDVPSAASDFLSAPRIQASPATGCRKNPLPAARTEKKEAVRLLLMLVPAGLALSVLTFTVLHFLSGITLPLTGILAAGAMLLTASASLLFLLKKTRKRRAGGAAGPLMIPDPDAPSKDAPHTAPSPDVPAEHTADKDRKAAEPPRAASYGTETTILKNGDDKAACLRAENAVMAPVILPPGEHRIGKSAELADVVLSQPGISRLHAELAGRGGDWYLKDLGSRNGTALNGELLPPNTPVRLSDRDRIAFGGLEFTFLRAQTG